MHEQKLLARCGQNCTTSYTDDGRVWPERRQWDAEGRAIELN